MGSPTWRHWCIIGSSKRTGRFSKWSWTWWNTPKWNRRYRGGSHHCRICESDVTESARWTVPGRSTEEKGRRNFGKRIWCLSEYFHKNPILLLCCCMCNIDQGYLSFHFEITGTSIRTARILFKRSEEFQSK